MDKNLLFFGDNLGALRDRDRFPSNSIDLVYLDPPFNSKRVYNTFFRERDGSRSAAMFRAFQDTWTWNEESATSFDELVRGAAEPVRQTMIALQRMMPRSDMLAYLSMMAPRLAELHRVLKQSGSLYLHCDPTASHYLKLLLDAIFGPARFLNEIIWKRSSAHSDVKQGMKRCGKIHDTVLHYTKTHNYYWHPQYTAYTPDYLRGEYRHIDPKSGRRFKQTDPTAAKPGGDVEYDWHVKRPVGKRSNWTPDLRAEYRRPKDGFEYMVVRPYRGRFWGYSKENLIAFWKAGTLHHRKTGMPRLIQFEDEMPGIPLQDVWDDIPPESGDRDMDYPTQKPLKLLLRIINASCPPGGVVLDPFCGCGTAVDASQESGRKWCGIDVTHLAVSLIKLRLALRHDLKPGVDYEVQGEPADWESAKALAEGDRFSFQAWAIGRLTAQPIGEAKKGKDRGIDGRYYFQDGAADDAPKEVLISVKSGRPKVTDLRDLRGVVDREGAEIGVLVTLNPPTAEMVKEAADGKYYRSPWAGDRKYPKLQIITVAELLDGKTIDCPPWSRNASFKAPVKTARRKERPDECRSGPKPRGIEPGSPKLPFMSDED